MPALTWDGGEIDLPELACPRQILLDYKSVEEMHTLLKDGIIERTQKSVNAWIGHSPQRRKMFQNIQKFLSGRKIEDASTIFLERYNDHLLSSQRAQAHMFLASQIMTMEKETRWICKEEGDDLILVALPVATE